MTETLWDFATSAYERAGVAELCLRLQDDIGADVNMLLTAAWLAEQGQRWQHDDVHKLITHCAEWRERCVVPLRAVRRYLKTHPLYEQAKTLELSAEIHQLHLLQQVLQSMPLTTAAGAQTDVLTMNLLTYIDCLDPSQAASAELRLLIENLRR